MLYIFLFEQVYERCPEDTVNVESEKVQSEALRLLFAVIHHSSSLEQEYINIGGHALLGKVLTSCRSVVGKHVLKASYFLQMYHSWPIISIPFLTNYDD